MAGVFNGLDVPDRDATAMIGHGAIQGVPTRTLHSFGAVGDGVTDDAAAIQRAITWGLANNGKITGDVASTYGIGAVWPVVTGTGTIEIDMGHATLKGLTGSTVVFEVAGKAGRQALLRGFVITGLGRTSGSFGFRVRNCQTVSFDDFKITSCGVALDIVNDGTGPGNAWNESCDFNHFQMNSNAITRQMRIINGGADSFGGEKFRGNVMSDTDTGHYVAGTAAWYGGSEEGLVMFLSAAGSPLGFDVEGSVEGTSISGRMESTTANTPTAITFRATAIKTHKSRWRLTLTGNGITTLNDLTTSGSPMLDVVRTWVTYPEVIANGKGSRLGFYGRDPVARPGILNTTTSIYNALIQVGLFEPQSPLTLVTPLHAFWADDPDWARPADGALVDFWRNSSSGGNPAAVGAARPTMRHSVAAFNNYGAVEFGGTQQLDFDIVNLVQPLKFVIVFNTTGGGAAIRELFGRGTAGSAIGLDSTNHSRLHFGTLLAGATAIGTSAAHVMRTTANGVTSAIFLDGASDATGATGSGGVGRLTIGASSDATPAFTTNWVGNIAFFGIYDGATPDASLEALEDLLGTLYGIVIA